ncbi:MAG TPA: glycosyl hydrolase family 28 protein [Mycobacteriales bacterium]|nr:glycosyl hydrolase family 28 protein [Mycobacteriales bacterium]
MRWYRHSQSWPEPRRTAAGVRRLGLRLLAVASVAAAAGGVAVGVAGPAAAAPQLLNVRDFGATGNGSSNDTAAINRAITAANAAAGGGIVEFPAGTYKSSNSIHMKSNVTLQLDAGSTIIGASGAGYDAPEANPNDDFQDFGHSHFHDAMIWGDRLTNIGFVGAGTIDGGGHLITGNPDSGEADKIISLTRCQNLELSGITLRRGGHFAALINGCDTVHSDHLTINTASDRDAWNIISTTNVTITNGDINGNDDAIVFKSDYALGAKLPNGHVSVTDTHASAGCCNALMFGSETCGDFTDYNFERITITGANKSGLGMVSMDGANISDVHYRDITMTNVASPIMQKIGTRKRCGNNPGVGHISNITYDNITGTGKSSPQFSPTLWGESGGNRISDITFTNVNLTVPGGSGTMGTGLPSNDPNNYNPNSIGTRPAYGWLIHNANNIRFVNSSVRFQSNDGRPAVIVNAGSSVTFAGFTAQRGSNSPHDVGMQSVTGYCVAGQNTSGAALRVSATSSTQTCTGGGTATRYEAENATISQGAVESNHAGFSGAGFVNGDNVVGSGVTWTVTMAQAGSATVSVRFANGQASGAMTNRPMGVTVNGAAAGSITFPPTGDWAVWQTGTVTLPLVAGANTIQLTATTATGGPNLDFLEA